MQLSRKKAGQLYNLTTSRDSSGQRLKCRDCPARIGTVGNYAPTFINIFVIPDIKYTTNSKVFTLSTTLILSVSSSTFFFIVGIICGLIILWLIKKTKSKSLKSDRNSPVYEVVQHLPSTAAENQQTPKEVDIQLNEAYGPL